VGQAALELLGHRVDVAEAALERIALEDGGPAGGVIDGVHHVRRLLRGVGRGHADRHALVEAQHAEPPDVAPDRLERCEQEPACRPQPRLALTHLRLDHGALA